MSKLSNQSSSAVDSETSQSQSKTSNVESKILTSNDSITLAIDGFGTVENVVNKKQEIIRRYTWRNAKENITIQVISYGATITLIQTPDRHGVAEDIVLGFENIDGYLDSRNPYFGTTVGRVCNRIAHGTFELNGKTIQISKNWNNLHTLHGGFIGFNKFNWNSYNDGLKVIMTHVSDDGWEGFPGTVMTTVTYELLSNNSFQIKFSATSTKPTPINLTNHSYFNLAGHGAGYPEIYKHIVSLNADKITETDETSIPTGNLLCVGGSLYDFRIPRELGPMMAKVPSQGYDDNFCVTQGSDQKLTFIARVIHPETGRSFELYSDQPGVQFYTSNFMPDPLKIITPNQVNLQYFFANDDEMTSKTNQSSKSTSVSEFIEENQEKINFENENCEENENLSLYSHKSSESGVKEEPLIGKNGAQYLKHGAFCLETQKYPDAVNHKNFPSTILNPGETYTHEIIYKFGIHKGPFSSSVDNQAMQQLHIAEGKSIDGSVISY